MERLKTLRPHSLVWAEGQSAVKMRNVLCYGIDMVVNCGNITLHGILVKCSLSRQMLKRKTTSNTANTCIRQWNKLLNEKGNKIQNKQLLNLKAKKTSFFSLWNRHYSMMIQFRHVFMRHETVDGCRLTVDVDQTHISMRRMHHYLAVLDPKGARISGWWYAFCGQR